MVVPAPAAAADVAELLPPAAGVLPEVLLELAHADTASARAASPAAPHIFRIGKYPLIRITDLPTKITYGWAFQFTLSS
jgi:hypothetical protein